MKKLLSVLLLVILCVLALVACEGPSAPTQATKSGIESAKEYLFAMYKDDPVATMADYKVVSKVVINGTTYDVIWTTDASEEDVEIIPGDAETLVKILQNEPQDDINYTLTATVCDTKGNVTVSFPHLIPKFALYTYDEFVALEDGATANVEGIVTGFSSKTNGAKYNTLFLQNETGGFYVYNLTADPVTEGVEIGMKVRVSGTKSFYDVYELINANFSIVDSNKTPVTPADYTAIFTKADSVTDADLVKYQSILVTIKGVEITGEEEKSGYYKFALDGVESYVRISSSTCPLTADEKTIFTQQHLEKAGYNADVTGIVTLYSGNFYLVPVTVDAYHNFNLPELSPAEQVAKEKDNLTFVTEVLEDTEIDLPSTGKAYTDVAITWASDNAAAVVKNGKLVVTLAKEACNVTVTATLTHGDVTDTKEFTVSLDSAVEYSFKQNTPANKTGVTKMVLQQNTLGATLYFDGTVTSAEYLGTTRSAKNAVDVEIVEESTGRYYIKYGAKYIEIYENTAGKVRVRIVETPTNTWGWNEEAGVFCMTLANCQTEKNNGVHYLGTYNNYDTISASNISYITGSNLSKIDDSQFPVKFGTVTPADQLTFNLLTEDTYEHATITDLSASQGKRGDSVTFKVTADEGYDVVAVKANGVALEAVEGVYTVTFDLADVRITIQTAANAQVAHAGTLEDPYDVADANLEASKLPSGKTSEGKVYVTGYIKSFTDKGSYLSNLYLTSDPNNDSAETFLVYSANFTSTVTSVAVGDQVILYGYLKNYQGTPEMADLSKDYPVFALATDTFTISVDEESAPGVTFSYTQLDKYSRASTVEVTVSVDSSKIKDVVIKVNGKDVTPVENKFTLLMDKDIVLKATGTVEGGPVSLEKLTFPDANSSSNKVSGYDKTWTAKSTNLTWTINNFNNNSWNNSWTLIKCGREKYDSVASIVVSSPDVVKQIVINGTFTKLDKVNSVKVYVSSTSDFASKTTVAEIDPSTLTDGDVTFTLSTAAAAGSYIMIEFDCAKTGKNGTIVINSVELLGDKSK